MSHHCASCDGGYCSTSSRIPTEGDSSAPRSAQALLMSQGGVRGTTDPIGSELNVNDLLSLVCLLLAITAGESPTNLQSSTTNPPLCAESAFPVPEVVGDTLPRSHGVDETYSNSKPEVNYLLSLACELLTILSPESASLTPDQNPLSPSSLPEYFDTGRLAAVVPMIDNQSNGNSHLPSLHSAGLADSTYFPTNGAGPCGSLPLAPPGPISDIPQHSASKRSRRTAIRRRKRQAMYQCPYADCDADFTTPDNLENHVNIHLNIRPHSCKYKEQGCVYSASARSTAKRHSKTCPFKRRDKETGQVTRKRLTH